MTSESGATYRDAGVDLDAAGRALAAIRPHVERTHTPKVIGGFGGFAGLYELSDAGFSQPVMVTSVDGVGTKLELARVLGRFDTIGLDLVAMVVDDLVVVGATPLVFADYLAVGRLDPVHVEQVVSGIADGCEQAGCALIGGEIAEHPAVLAPGQFDVAGFGVGLVERERILGPERVRPGAELVAMASTGPHSNGYSLVRRLVAGLDLRDDHGLRVQSLGAALLRPTRIYAPACLALAGTGLVQAYAHVTGGGVRDNLARVLPEGLGATIDTRTFAIPDVLLLLQRHGGVTDAEMWRTFNMGAGMIAVVSDGRRAVEVLASQGVDAWVCGRVSERADIALVGVDTDELSPGAAQEADEHGPHEGR